MRFRTLHILLSTILMVLCACKSEPEAPPVIGRAFVGPYELDLIAELAPDADIIATLEHGQPVDIMERRRRFAKVRVAAGVEGWTDGRLLLSASAMARLRRLAMNAARLPSQGKATVFDTLNVHIEPNRQAPSFYQMQEGILAEVVAHRVIGRTAYQPLPDSDTGVEALNSYARPSATPEGVVDDWSLLRLSDGRAGWVLSRMLVMAIPDEVAQYAGGHRITSYASLGRVEDDGQVKHHWLWTTQSSGGRTFQFDGFRIFVWSLRRHRYETAFRQRNVIGYYPVQVLPPDENAKGSRQMSRFSLTIREDDGRTYQRIYSFSGYRVKLEEQFPWEAPPEIRRAREAEYVDLPADETPSLFEKLVQRVFEFFTSDNEESE
jgi:hypothetical protein